ncbi:putative reverse transcriptase zinc-binding domain-containing protein [Helianthus debilis subsp. tardiflorus]
MNRVCHWNTVIETIQNRLSSWKAKTLSMGGRLTLIKSVLSSLPIYYLSIYKAPVMVLDHMERLMRNFLWAGSDEVKKVHWVAWEVITTPKKDGGLGISRMLDVNLALLAKWAWRFTVENDSIWRGFIEAIHGGRGFWSFLPVKRAIPRCWKSIVNVLENMRLADKSLHQLIRGVVGSGNNIRFWFDHWLGDVTLKSRWPCLYKLDRNKGCKVNDRLKQVDSGMLFAGVWSRQPRSVEELSEMQDLRRLILGFRFSGLADRWVWNDGSKGPFSVADCKRLYRINDRATSVFSMKWEHWIPIKVNLLSWRAGRYKLPTRMALRRRRINIPVTSCPFCNFCDEDINHLMVGCGFSYGVWSLICKWCKLDPFFAYDFEDLLLLYKNVHAGKWRKKIIRGIVMVTAWVIWNVRNEKIFQNKDNKIADVVAEVKSKAFLWLKHRSKYKNIVWKDWASYPLYMCV